LQLLLEHFDLIFEHAVFVVFFGFCEQRQSFWSTTCLSANTSEVHARNRVVFFLTQPQTNSFAQELFGGSKAKLLCAENGFEIENVGVLFF